MPGCSYDIFTIISILISSYLVPEIAMVSAVVTPLAEAMMSKMVSADHQGIKYNINVTIKYTTYIYIYI